jgi:hypothetical protein
MEKKYCIYCHAPVSGRADKKYCDDACRSAYNNRINQQNNCFIKRIDNALKRNRRILISLMPQKSKRIKVTFKKLAAMGFNFNYVTHILASKNGLPYFYCYDVGYQPINEEYYVVVKQHQK